MQFILNAFFSSNRNPSPIINKLLGTLKGKARTDGILFPKSGVSVRIYILVYM